MTQAWVLGQRALREGWRTAGALVPTLFIPLFFLVVNVGQAAEIFPSTTTAFLHGDIEGGYFDKLRASPIPRTAIVLGRLIAEAVKGVLIAAAIVLLALVFGITIASGPLGFLLLVSLTALWS